MITFYPLKNNRIGIALGPFIKRTDYERAFPFARSKVFIIVMTIITTILGVIEWNVFQQFASMWSSANQLFGLVTLVFLGCWLLAWSFGLFICTVILLFALFGRALLLIYQGRVEIQFGLPGIAIIVRRSAKDIGHVGLVDYDTKSVFPKRGQQLVIREKNAANGDDVSSPLGSDMNSQDVFEVHNAIKHAAMVDAQLDAKDFHLSKKQESLDTADLVKQDSDDSSQTSLTVLVLANLVPLVGALFFAWSLSEIMVLYWVETGVILLYHLVKFIVVSPLKGVFKSLIALAQVGGFMAIHFLFVWEFFVRQGTGSEPLLGSTVSEVASYLSALWPALIALVVSHGYSFFVNFWPKRGLFKKQRLELKSVMSRVIILHVVLIVGGFLTRLTGQTAAGVILLIAIKIVVDGYAHKGHNSNLKLVEQ